MLTTLLCTEVKQIITKVISTSVAQVRPVRTLRLCMLLSPSMKAVIMMPALLTSAPLTAPCIRCRASIFSLNFEESTSVMPEEIRMITKPSRIMTDERIIWKAGWSRRSSAKTTRKMTPCAASCLRMSVKPKTSFSKKKMKGTSSPMYQRMPQMASEMAPRMTGWLRIR